MLHTFLLLFFILLLNFPGFSQKKTDLLNWGVKGKVHQINYYQGYDEPQADRGNSPVGELSAISVLNRKGNLSVQFEFWAAGPDCFYKQTVYFYDRKNRKKEKLLFESEKNTALCALRPPLFKENQNDYFDVKTSLIEKTTFDYDRKGRLLRETVYDQNQAMVQENKYEYNARGENTRFTIKQKQNRITGASREPVKTIDFRMSYRDNGKTKETFRYEDGKPIYKGVHYLDKRGRTLGNKQYKLETDPQLKIIRETLVSFSKTYYDGAYDVLDWTIYDNSGKLATRLYILSENDDELVRVEYTHRQALTDPIPFGSEKLTHYGFDWADEPEINQRLKYLVKFDQSVESSDWIPQEFEARLYKFDARGNIVQTSTIQKNNPAENSRLTVRKKDIIYFK